MCFLGGTNSILYIIQKKCNLSEITKASREEDLRGSVDIASFLSNLWQYMEVSH
jgi:hypothetical protein